MSKYKYILFDLDGTLTRSHYGIFNCFRYALQKMGVTEEPTEETLKKCVGPSLEYSFENYFHMSKEDAVTATAKYRERYKDIGIWENEPIEGALESLKALKEAGYVLALATSKPKIFADQIVEKFGFSIYFSSQVGCGLDGSFPTKASVIAEVMRQLSASKDECLMVGDRFHDADGAKENGVDCALLKVGYAEDGEIEQAKPEYVFTDFADFTEFLIK